jgi:HlyD family secretion protein
VLSRLVEPGSRIAMGGRTGEGEMAGAVVRLYTPSKLQVRVDVPLGDAAKIGVGTLAQITTEALPDRTFTGSVTRVLHEANIQRNTVQFKVALEGPAPELKPEMLCRVRFNPASPSGSGAAPESHAGLRLVLPASTVFNRQDDRGQVWLVQNSPSGGSTAELKEVQLGGEEGADFTILAGVSPGDRAIVNPPTGLKPGSRVKILGEAPTPQE